MADGTRVFFSHATEDKGRVLQVYGRLIEAYPDLDPWIDTFEIVGGQQLLDAIAAGMDAVSRFFVFLSPVSIGKSWVKAELRRALTQELGGARPDYVIPVKMGGLQIVPPFVESKKYIDLDRLTEREWLAEFYAAATGAKLPSGVVTKQNLEVHKVADPALTHVAQLSFRALHWAEEAAFAVGTSSPATAVSHAWAAGGRGGAVSYAKKLSPTEIAFSLPTERLTPGADLRITVEFAQGVDALAALGNVRPWDGSGATESGVLFMS